MQRGDIVRCVGHQPNLTKDHLYRVFRVCDMVCVREQIKVVDDSLSLNYYPIDSFQIAERSRDMPGEIAFSYGLEVYANIPVEFTTQEQAQGVLFALVLAHQAGLDVPPQPAWAGGPDVNQA